MQRRTLLTGAAALALVRPAFAAEPTKVLFWHAMNGALGDSLNKLIARFNSSQNAVEVVGVFKGGYPETLTAAIAAWRAGQAPHIVQVFDVGTGSMVAAGPAVKDLWQLVNETGAPIKPANYIASVRGYYSLPDGRMASMPFNSSTAVLWYNQDAFEKAGLDPAKPPATWPELVAVAEMIKAKNVAKYAVTTSWPTWIHFEQFAAIHNLPYGTAANGFKGLDAELLIDGPGFVANLQRLLDMAKAGIFKYAGRDNLPDPLFYSGQGAITFNSSAARGALVKSAKFRFADAYLPYDPRIIKKPINSIIGGASLWTMTASTRVDDDRVHAHAAGVQGGRRLPCLPRRARAGRRMGRRHGLCTGHLRRRRSAEAAGILHQQPRHRNADSAARTAAGDRQFARHSARQYGRATRHHRGGVGEGARRPAGRQAGPDNGSRPRQRGIAQLPALNGRLKAPG